MSKYDMGNVPIGFALALGENMEAFEAFSKFSKEEKDRIIEKTHSIRSKQEMHDFVNSLKNSY